MPTIENAAQNCVEVCTPVVADLHHFDEEQDPDSHQSGKSDPDLHQIEKSDPAPHQNNN
jgi:hypothetical protein